MTVILDKPYNKQTLRVRKLTQTSVSAICLFPHCSKKKTNRYYVDAKESSRCLGFNAMLGLFSTCTRRRPARNAKIIGHVCEPTLHSSLFSRLIFTVHLPRRLYCCNRPFARWRHFITMTIILQGLIFLCKLGLLLVKPQWDYQIKIWKEKRKGFWSQ